MTKIHFEGSKQTTEAGVATVFKAAETNFKIIEHRKSFNVEDIKAVNYPRVLIFVNAFANTINNKSKVIRDGNIIELPAGESLSFRGMAEYYIIG